MAQRRRQGCQVAMTYTSSNPDVDRRVAFVLECSAGLAEASRASPAGEREPCTVTPGLLPTVPWRRRQAKGSEAQQGRAGAQLRPSNGAPSAGDFGPLHLDQTPGRAVEACLARRSPAHPRPARFFRRYRPSGMAVASVLEGSSATSSSDLGLCRLSRARRAHSSKERPGAGLAGI